MSIISGRALAKYFGAQDVFADVEFDIAHGDKIGLVGPNGAGKTTLLRIILGMDEPTQGTVQRARGLRLGYLPQQAQFPSDQALYPEMLTVFGELRNQERALHELTAEMAHSPDDKELVERYARAAQRFEFAGGYEYENRVRRVLSGLAFTPEMYEWPISVLSGGQVTRALLAKLLLQEPDLLILDEPTNYLDLKALEWLEAFLSDWRSSLLVVSHDRYFLDQVVTRIWEMSYKRLDWYRGNYSQYVEQREARRLAQEVAYKRQQQEIAETEDFIRRYKAGQRSKQARGRETRLARLERIQRPEKERALRLRLSTNLRSGDNVLMTDGAVIGYRTKPGDAITDDAEPEAHPLLETGELLIQRGQRVALLGPNGSGKTTFLRTILDQIEPLEGDVRIGASVRIGYLPQSQDWLDGSKTVLEQLLDYGPDLTIAEGRSILGRFLFSGEEVYKDTGTLSGGERSRLALAILTTRGANFLLLDEPTTHLDVQAQDVLQNVLTSFNGTILFVTHDRYLMDALASHIWMLEDGTINCFKGNYSAYLAAQAGVIAEQAADTGDGESSRDERREQVRAQRREERQAREQVERLERLEHEIEDLEQQLADLMAEIDHASVSHNMRRVHALSKQYQQAETRLQGALQEWEASMHAVQED